jgi:hypothetical protein
LVISSNVDILYLLRQGIG